MNTTSNLRFVPFNEDEIVRCVNVQSRYVCTICTEICFTIRDLKNHYINTHGYTSNIGYESSDESLAAEREVKKKEVVKNVLKPPKICEICNQQFKTAKILSRHIKHVHNKIKNFHCSVCSKQFSRKAALQVKTFDLKTQKNELNFVRRFIYGNI